MLFALQKDEESGKDLVTGLVIDKFCEGYSISSPWEKIGYRGSEVYDIFLDDVKVTEDQILGKPGDGFTQLLGTTAYGKLGFTAVFVGTALGAADIALKYCQEKLHRGKSITKFPTTQLRLSTMLTYAHTAELLLLEAADYCDHNHFRARRHPHHACCSGPYRSGQGLCRRDRYQGCYYGCQRHGRLRCLRRVSG